MIECRTEDKVLDVEEIIFNLKGHLVLDDEGVTLVDAINYANMWLLSNQWNIGNMKKKIWFETWYEGEPTLFLFIVSELEDGLIHISLEQKLNRRFKMKPKILLWGLFRSLSSPQVGLCIVAFMLLLYLLMYPLYWNKTAIKD